MGNFEKLVVLAVLFLSAIVLAVSLNDGNAEGERLGTPLEAARGDATPGSGPKASAPKAEERLDFLLNTEVTPSPEPDVPAAGALEDGPQDGRILRATEGLESAGIADYMVYTVESGDTWAGLSERFYRTSRHVHLLRTANEEVQRLVAGERILIPVYDFAQDAGEREPFRAVARHEQAPPGALASTAPTRGSEGASRPEAKRPVSTAAAVADSSAEIYEVQPGDNLSRISQKVYGTSARWKLIYDANRDKLESPDWLQVGMSIAIPRGELPVAPAADAEPAGGNVVR